MATSRPRRWEFAGDSASPRPARAPCLGQPLGAAGCGRTCPAPAVPATSRRGVCAAHRVLGSEQQVVTQRWRRCSGTRPPDGASESGALAARPTCSRSRHDSCGAAPPLHARRGPRAPADGRGGHVGHDLRPPRRRPYGEAHSSARPAAAVSCALPAPVLLLLTLGAAMAPAASARAHMLPANYSTNVTFNLANTSARVRWSSEDLRLPGFVRLTGPDDGFNFSVSPAGGDLPSEFANALSIGADYSLVLPFAGERQGGHFTFTLTMSFTRAMEPQAGCAYSQQQQAPSSGGGGGEAGNATGACGSQSAASNETVVVASQTFNLTVFSAYAKMRLVLATDGAQLPLVRSNAAHFLGVDVANVFVEAAPDGQQRRLLTNHASLPADLEVWSTTVNASLAAARLFSSTSAAALSTALGVNATLISSGAFFLDAAAAEQSYLRLAQPSWVISSCPACAATYHLAGLVTQITMPDLAAGPDGRPVYTLQVEYVRHRTSAAEGYGAWLSDAVWYSQQNVQQSVSPSLVDNTLSLTVENETVGEVEFRVRVANSSAAALLRVNVAPTNRAPGVVVSLPPSTVPALAAARRLLSAGANQSLEVYENSAPFTINLTDIDRGGWAGTSNLSYTLSFSQTPLPLVSDVVFDAACYTMRNCSAVVTLHPHRMGATVLSITVQNSGARFTPLGIDSYSVHWELRVVNVNDKPSFVVRSAALNVDEDSTCVLMATEGSSLSALQRQVCTQGSTPLLHVYPNFLTSISAGLYEDKSALGCPAADPFAAVPGACLDQNVTFVLTPAAGQPASAIFAEDPTVFANGTLRFRLAPDQVGETVWNATLRDDGVPPRTASQLFSIFVLSINDPPTFELETQVMVFEGSSAWSGIVVDNITAGCLACTDENENICARDLLGGSDTSCQTVYMDVQYSVPFPHLFTPNGQPRLERISTEQAQLTFEVAPDQFGLAHIDVVMIDSGGLGRGGRDTSAQKRLTIRVVPVNDPPTFELATDRVALEENSGDLPPMQLATGITAGKSNEDCAAEDQSSSCQDQRVTFVIEYIEGAELFSTLPAVDPAGVLTLRVSPGVTGVSRVYLRLEDDGVVQQGSRGNVSATRLFSVVVTPVEYQANFSLGRNVSCLRKAQINSPGGCTCPPQTEGQRSLDTCAAELAPGEAAHIRIIEHGGPQMIEAFATDITNAVGYLPGSLSVFTRNETTGLLDFQEQRIDEIAGLWGMEYAADFRVSPDARHVYAAEAETDSIAIFDISQGTDTAKQLTRLADAQRRLIFRGFDASDAYSRTPMSVPTQDLSSLATFWHDSQAFILAAQGADHVREDVKRLARRSVPASVSTSKYQDLYAPADLWARTTACWVFDLESVFAPPGISESELRARFNVDPADFAAQGETGDRVHERMSDVQCGRNGCSFSRNVSSIDHDWCPRRKKGACPCAERYPTLVKYASVRDLTGRTGPVLLTGPQCKVMSNCTNSGSQQKLQQCYTRGTVLWNETANDWDTPEQQLDLRTFIMSNGEISAMQFDDNLNSGLFLTYDMKKVVDAMPHRNISVEVWFTIDAQPDVDPPPDDDEPSEFVVDPRDYPVRRALVGSESYADLNNAFDVKFCAQGWSLSYAHQESHTILRFQIGLQGSKSGDREDGNPLEVVVTPRIPQGEWQHLVASYDGHEYIHIYLNGAHKGTGKACSAAPCRDILYPGLQARESATRPPLNCQLRPYNFSIGGWKNGEDQLKDFLDFTDPDTNSDYLSMGRHLGAIHMVRIYDVALAGAQVSAQFDRLKGLLHNNSLSRPVSSWASQQVTGRHSPSIDFARTIVPQRVEVHGYFDVFSQYRCEWHGESSEAGAEEEVAYSMANTTEASGEGYTGQRLWCQTPEWGFGVRLTRFYISSLHRGRWKRLWMKVCLEAACGFVPGPDGRQAMYSADVAVNGQRKLLSNVAAVPKIFRFVQSSSIHTINMTAAHTFGPVTGIELTGTSKNLIDGTVRIFSAGAVSSGGLLQASFVVNATRNGGSISVVDGGVGYPAEGGVATVCHPDSFEPIADTVTQVAILDGGGSFISGSWEVVSGQYEVNYSTPSIETVTCNVSPRGTFKAQPITSDMNGLYGGQVIEVNVEFHGEGCVTEIIPESVQLYYSGTRQLQLNSITQVVGLSVEFRGNLFKANTMIQPDIGIIPPNREYIDAVAVCGNNCTGSGFKGKCWLVFENGEPKVTDVSIDDHGTGYSLEFKPEIRCVWDGQQYDILGEIPELQIYAEIPSAARIKMGVARGGVARYSTAAEGVLLRSEPGLAGGSWSGIWSNSTGESVRPLWPAMMSFTPVQFEFPEYKNVSVLVSERTAVNTSTPGANGTNTTTTTYVNTSKFVTKLLAISPTTTFVLASNFWDGLTGRREVLTSDGYQLIDHELSYLMLWNSDSSDLSCVQAINTSGAASLHHFRMMDVDYVVAANYREVFPGGQTSTVARSAVYRFGLGNPAGDAPTAPGVGGRTAPEKCGADSPLGQMPLWTLDATRFRTAGAVSVDTFTMNHSTELGQVLYMVVANYYDSDAQVSSGLSKLYMVGKPQNETHSLFGVNASHLWDRCSDSQAVCGSHAQCHVHKCNQGCVVTQRLGQPPAMQCTCSNRLSQVCSVDSECNSGIVCIPQHAPVPPQDHTHCLSSAGVEFEGSSAEGRVVLCELQSFDVSLAHSVTHWQSDTVHIIVFASDSPGGSTKVFKSEDGAKPFLEVQALTLEHATNLQAIQPTGIDRPFLLVSQGTESLLYQWNGTWLIQQQTLSAVNPEAMTAISYLDKADTRYAVFGGGNERIRNSIHLLSGFSNVLPTFDAPGALAVSPDGRHVYVASARSRSILQFARDAPSGEIEYQEQVAFPFVDGLTGTRMPRTPWGSEVPAERDAAIPAPPGNPSVTRRDGPGPGHYGYPMRGVVSVLMAHSGSHLYAASFYDSSVHIWRRDVNTGTLSWQSAFSDPRNDEDMRHGRTGLGPGGYYLRGPRAMALGQNDGGSTMVLACASSRSVVLLQRNVTDGSLKFVDAVRDGERDVSTFNASAPPAAPGSHPFPTRIGGGHGAGAGGAGRVQHQSRKQQEQTWARSAQVVRPFVLRGRQMLAIASSGAKGDAPGAAVIMEWKGHSGGATDMMGTFEQVQVLADDTSAVDIAFFQIEAHGADVTEYLVVANAYGSTNVYLWEQDGFLLHHSLPIPRLAYDRVGCSCLCPSQEEQALPVINRTELICGACFENGVLRQSPDTCGSPRPSNGRECAANPFRVFPRAIKHMFVDAARQHFLAVAYWSVDHEHVLMLQNEAIPKPDCLHVYSHIYRWNEDTPRLLPSGRVVWGSGFEPFFPVATSGAIAAEHVSVPSESHGTLDLVGFVEFAGATSAATRVRLFRFVRQVYNPFLKTFAGSFEEYQVLPVAGAFSMHAFTIEEEGTFLAVAARQNASVANIAVQSEAERAAFLAHFDMPSALLKWNGTVFQMHQRLGPVQDAALDANGLLTDLTNCSNSTNSTDCLGGQAVVGETFYSVAGTPGTFDAHNLNATRCATTPLLAGCGGADAVGWAQAEGLRGATSMHAFTDVDGEVYLAIAQSVCDPIVSSRRCNHTAHPMSTVLQWDRVSKRFTELLAYTDASHARRFAGAPVRDEDIRMHQTSLRIPAGRARQWSTMVVGGDGAGKGWPGVVVGAPVRGRMTLLIAATLDEGALVYEFRFNEIVGLAGAAAVTLSPHGDFLYAASEDDHAMAVFALRPRYDVTNRSFGLFRQLQVLSEEPLEGGDLIRTPVAKGLRGIRQLTHDAATDCNGYEATRSSSGSAHSYGPGEACSTILVRGTVPRSQLPCGEQPPVQLCSPSTPHLCTPQIDSMEPLPMCRDIMFRTEPVPDAASNPRLFTDDGAPHLIQSGPHKGALTFTSRNGETGKARFRVTMEKAVSGVLAGAAGSRRLLAASEPVVQEFVIEVLPVNDPPVIHETRDMAILNSARRRFEVFATSISAEGLGIENYTWEWDVNNITHPPQPYPCRIQNASLRAQAEAANGVNCSLLNYTTDLPPLPPNYTSVMQSLFIRTPEFSFRYNEDGTLQGIVDVEPNPVAMGELRFYLRMHDGTAIDPVTGSSPTSAQISFLITILPTNYKPSFVAVPASFHLVEGQGVTTQKGFVTDIKTGILSVEAEQKVSFSVSHFEALNVVGFNVSVVDQVIQKFDIDENGTLTFRMAPDFAGDVQMFIRIEDDAAGTNGGNAFSLVGVYVSVAPVNDAPRLLGNGQQYFKCGWTNVTYTVMLNESDYLRLRQTLDCDFKDDWCGYTPASHMNASGVKVPWVRANRRFVPYFVRNPYSVTPIYYGSGPEYGQEANCFYTFDENPIVVKNHLWSNDPPEVQVDPCHPEYYAAADASSVTWTAEDLESLVPEMAKDTISAGDYGFIQSEPVTMSGNGIVYVDILGGFQQTFRTDVVQSLVYTFYFSMFDGQPSYGQLPGKGEMGSLKLQARANAADNFTTIWEKVGAHTRYNEWAYANVSVGPSLLQGTGLELRFLATRTSDSNSYSVMAIDSLLTNGTVLRDDRMQRCTMQMSVAGTFFDSIRTIDKALVVEQPPDELMTQTPSFVITVLSGEELFFDAPTALADGTLVLPLARSGRGTAVISAIIRDDGDTGGENQNASEPFEFELIVDGFEELPGFFLQPTLSVLDGAGLENFTKFADVSTLAGLDEAALKYVRFYVKCTSSAPGMWEHHPSIDPVGTLRLAVTPGYSGRGYCGVKMGATDTGLDESPPQYFSVRVWPRPEILSVSPALSSPFMATHVTIRGRNFRSVLSPGGAAESVRNVTAYVTTPYTYTLRGIKYRSVRWEPCIGGTKYVGDEQLLCTISPGAGLRDIKVEVLEGSMNRTGTLLRAFVGVEMWLGGTAEDPHCQAYGAPWPHRQEAIAGCGQRGFLGSGPGPTFLPPRVDMVRLNVSSAVRALAVSKRHVFMGGSFSTVNSTRVNGIISYNLETVRTLALGLDGSVGALSVLSNERSLLVVGGSFARVYQSSGSIATGGLAVWDATSSLWGALGGVPLHGVSMAVVVKGTQVIVGGRFTGAGDVHAANVAVYQAAAGVISRGILLDPAGVTEGDGIAGPGGGRWHALGEGIKGMVYALAAGDATDVYAGGRFHLAGGVRVENVARWESVDGEVGGGYWTGLVDSDCLRLKAGVCGVNGDVWALAFVGGYLYVGGQFSEAGGKPASNVARFFSGVWEGVGKGVDGAVYVLTAIRIQGTLAGSCVYHAGDFRKVEDARGVMDVSGVARWCIGDPGTVLKVDDSKAQGGGVTEYWENVEVPDGVLSVRALASHSD